MNRPPGIRELGLWLGAEAIGSAFPEIETAAEGCRFRDCRHDGSTPGCAVMAAIERGDAGNWATQVLEGAAKKGTPTRAEITDAAAAAMDRPRRRVEGGA